jgi:RNA polymerase sigma-70 factor (ECF subfamily)
MHFIASATHKKIQKGDIKEFESQFKKLYSPLCHFAFRYLKDMDSAEEIVQDLFYTYWKNKEKIEIRTSLKSYLYQATKNKCLKLIEHNVVKERYASEMMTVSNNTTDSQSNSLETEELNSIIDRTLNELPEKCRKIFEMSRFEGMKYNEIAKALSVSIKTVEANMGKALKLFRTNLKQYDQITC